MERISKVSIAGFKSIRECQDLELRPLNVLIGANGTGKSNLLSFFRMLKHLQLGAFQEFIARSGGAQALLRFGAKETQQIEFAVVLESDLGSVRYAVVLPHAPPDRLFFATESLEHLNATGLPPTIVLKSEDNWESGLDQSARSPADVPAAKALYRLFGGVRYHHLNDTSDAAGLRVRSDLRQNRSNLLPDARNLATTLSTLRGLYPSHYRRIVETIRIVAPFFQDFVLEPEPPGSDFVMLRWRSTGHAEYELGPHQLSDGTLRFIALTTLLLSPKTRPPSIIALDEPELGLHPAALHVLAGLLSEASKDSQIVVSTQSMAFLDSFDPEDVIVAGLHDGASTFRRLNPNDLQEWLTDYSLGDLVRKNFIETGPSYA